MGNLTAYLKTAAVVLVVVAVVSRVPMARDLILPPTK